MSAFRKGYKQPRLSEEETRAPIQHAEVVRVCTAQLGLLAANMEISFEDLLDWIRKAHHDILSQYHVPFGMDRDPRR